MKIWQKAMGVLTCTICLGVACPQPGSAANPSVKTSLKRYTVHPYNDQKVMCEHYQVAKDDWLYKIFRQKGEISEEDFPLFLSMFKTLNPGISNIDAINPGQKVLIPLKKISREDFDETVPGIVDVPVVEFSTIQAKPSPRYKKYRVKKGDTVSELLDPVFLNRDGTLTGQGLELFTLANPGVKRIELIQEGMLLNLPTPREQKPVFAPEPVSPETVIALERYSRIHQGKLLVNGKYYFPSKGLTDQIIDLAYTPLIELKDNSRLIMIPDKNHYQKLAAAISTFWSDVTLVDIKTALETVATPPSTGDRTGTEESVNSREIPQNHKLAAQRMLEHTGFEYTPDAVVHLQVGTLDLDINVGKICRQGKPDLFIEYGDVYGFALERIHDLGYELISLLPNETTREIAVKLFTGLGIQVVEDPAFISTRTYRTITIPGVYIPGPSSEIILLDGNLDLEAEEFLRKNNISLLRLDLPDSGA